jgi:hypothetical protein
LGLAKAKDLQSVPMLVTVLNYYFDNELKRGHPTYYLYAIDSLRDLASLSTAANDALCSVVQKCCNLENIAKYPLINDQSLWDLYVPLIKIGGDKNRTFLEEISQQQCTNSIINEYAIKALGSIGDAHSIQIINSLAAKYPAQAKKSINQI